MPSHHSGWPRSLPSMREQLRRARLLREIVVDRALDALPVGVVDDHERARRRGTARSGACRRAAARTRGRCRSSRRRPAGPRARRSGASRTRRPRSASAGPRDRSARGCASSCSRLPSPSDQLSSATKSRVVLEHRRDERRPVIRADLDVALARLEAARCDVQQREVVRAREARAPPRGSRRSARRAAARSAGSRRTHRAAARGTHRSSPGMVLTPLRRERRRRASRRRARRACGPRGVSWYSTRGGRVSAARAARARRRPRARRAARERPRRDALERLLELVEAHRALLGRGPEDREHPAPPEEVSRAGDLLGQRLALLTPHAAAASTSARARGSALRRSSSPDGTSSPRARPRGRRRGRRGSAPG